MKDKAILDMGPEDLLAQGDQVLTRVAELDSRAVAVGGGVGVGAGAGAIVTSSGIEDGGVYTSHGIGIHVSIDENDQLTSSYEGESSRTLLKDLTAVLTKLFIGHKLLERKYQARYSRLSRIDDIRRILPFFSVVVPSAIKVRDCKR